MAKTTAKPQSSKIDQVRHLMGLKSNAKKTRKSMLEIIRERCDIKTAGMASRYYHMVKTERDATTA